MYNKIILQGNLTKDVEIRYTQGGSAIGNTGIAVTKKFKAQNGEQKEKTLFVDLTFFGRSAEIANQYLHKGSKVLIDGELQLDQWTAQDGTKRSKHTVQVQNMQMLDSKSDNQAPQQNREATGRNPDGTTYYGTSDSTPQSARQAPPTQPAPTQDSRGQCHPAPSSVPEIDIDSDNIPF